MNQTNSTPTISRLRKGGLTRTAAIAAVAATAALVTANAGIVYSGTVNSEVERISTPTLNVDVDNFGGPEFLLRAASGKLGLFYNIQNFANGFQFVATAPMAGAAAKLDAGILIDAGAAYSDGSANLGNGAILGPGASPGQWNGGDTGYLGFTFNPTGSSPLYGWAQISIGVGSTPLTLVDYAYDDGGASILTGDTGPAPVPEAATGLFGLGCLGALGLRRRRAAHIAT